MYFKQISVTGLGCNSYVIGCPGAKQAVVVDPKRDVQEYMDISRDEGMKITHIIETHVHADHVSGNQELKSRTGADIYYSEHASVTFEHKKLKEGDTIEFGMVKLEILYTPGHTPNSISILVTDKARADEPWMSRCRTCTIPFMKKWGGCPTTWRCIRPMARDRSAARA